jgi:membrane-associated protease RseP (regulator of RpoE activity)
MVRTLTWVLVGIVAYTVVAMALKARGRLPESVRVSGPITTLHTKRGRAFLNWLATPKRFWRAWGNFGLGVTLVVMVGSFALVIVSGLQALDQPEQTPIRNPQNVLVIPGVNDFLPLAAAPEIVFGLLVGLVVHEGGHGLLCRVEDIEIDSMGLALFAIIPIGAFVQPDEQSRIEASRGSQSRMFAAGVTNNFLITAVAFALLFGPVAGSVAVASGAPIGSVANGSSADGAGIGYGDVITSVDGQAVTDGAQLRQRLDAARGETVEIGLKNGSTKTVDRVPLLSVTSPVVENLSLDPSDPPVIRSVNGTAVHTERDVAAAFTERTVVSLETDRGTATFPVGAYAVRIDDDGPLANASAPTDGPLIVTHVGGQRVANTSALDRVTDGFEPGQTVTVVAYDDGVRDEYNVTLAAAESGDGTVIGVRVIPGYSALEIDDFGTDIYPAGQFLGLLGGGDNPIGNPIQQIVSVLFMPFFSTVPGIAYNFAGFLPTVTNFYTVTGPLAALGNGVFLLANVLFWTAWVNLNLGFFNCIPTFPLDGGHILRASTESLVARLPVGDGRRLTTALTVSVSLVMIGGLVLMVFGPQLVG